MGMNLIDERDKLALEGIAYVAKDLTRQLDRLAKMAADIVGEGDAYGHAADFVWGEGDVDDLLDKMGIEVVIISDVV